MVFMTVDMLRSGANPVFALQPLIQWGDLRYFQYLKQRFRAQNLTRKRATVELCDGGTNNVVVKAKKSKSEVEIAKNEIGAMK